MKNIILKIKSLVVILILIIFINDKCNSQNISQGELMIVNNTGTQTGKMIKVNIYPVGAIFSGCNQYSLDATNKIPSSSEKIYGYSKILNFNQNLNEDQWTIKINFDASELFQDCETSLGYGKYRIDFYSGPDQDNFLFIDYCIIDYSDANYGTSAFQGEQKIRIDFRPADQITFNFLAAPRLTTLPPLKKIFAYGNNMGAAIHQLRLREELSMILHFLSIRIFPLTQNNSEQSNILIRETSL